MHSVPAVPSHCQRIATPTQAVASDRNSRRPRGGATALPEVLGSNCSGRWIVLELIALGRPLGVGAGAGCAFGPGDRPTQARGDVVGVDLGDGALLALAGLAGTGAEPADDDGAVALGEGFGGVLGERIADTAIREVWEETGLEVVPETIVGIYSNPRHVVEYADGEVRQQFSICFACRPVGGELATSDESTEVGFFSPTEIEAMPMHESIRLRIRDYLEHRPQPVIA